MTPLPDILSFIWDIEATSHGRDAIHQRHYEANKDIMGNKECQCKQSKCQVPSWQSDRLKSNLQP
jgi:hypothetical protein